jgi:hypothetical protein
MQISQRSMKSLANHIAAPHNNSSDKRIRTHPTTPALRKLASLPQVGFIRACQLRFHRTD